MKHKYMVSVNNELVASYAGRIVDLKNEYYFELYHRQSA